MKKFNEWMEATNTSVGALHYGRFLGQIMGWDSHGDPDTWMGRAQNFVRGKHQRAQSMGADIYSIIENPNNISAVISRAQADGVYQGSTFNACYGLVRQWMNQYNNQHGSGPQPPPLPKFQAMLLYTILGKCNDQMTLSYQAAKNFYHTVMGTEPAVEKGLSDAYDKDPQKLTEWTAIADSTHKPHPSFNSKDDTAIYWQIEKDNLISPLNLIKRLVEESPHQTLSLPKNKGDLNNMSVEFAEAYFPHILNRRRGPRVTNNNNNNNAGGGGPQGTTLQDLINSLQHFDKNLSDVDKTKGDGSATTGKKRDLITALATLIGPTAAAQAAANPDSGSLMAVLKDHNSFFKMNQLLEQRKLD
jgi:hypothetical protein